MTPSLPSRPALVLLPAILIAAAYLGTIHRTLGKQLHTVQARVQQMQSELSQYEGLTIDHASVERLSDEVAGLEAAWRSLASAGPSPVEPGSTPTSLMLRLTQLLKRHNVQLTAVEPDSDFRMAGLAPATTGADQHGIWSLRFKGEYLDVVSVLADLAEQQSGPIALAIEMGPVAAAGPEGVSQWTLIIWI